MIEFIVGLGWIYVGECFCSEKRKVYTNSKYPNWQVHIGDGGAILQMRRSYGNIRDTKIKGMGGPANYKQVYEYWINQEQ